MPSPIKPVSRSRARAALGELLPAPFEPIKSGHHDAQASLIIEEQVIEDRSGPKLTLQLWREQTIKKAGKRHELRDRCFIRAIHGIEQKEFEVPERLLLRALRDGGSPLVGILAGPKAALLPRLGQSFAMMKTFHEKLAVAQDTGALRGKSASQVSVKRRTRTL